MGRAAEGDRAAGQGNSAPPAVVPAVAGLEAACERGGVAQGQWVLFNGASFLLDLNDSAMRDFTDEKVAAMLSSGKPSGWCCAAGAACWGLAPPA